MRAKIYLNENTGTNLTFNGGQLSGPLILQKEPSEDLEAVPKKYVDSLLSNLSNIDASNLKTSILPETCLPEFTGDVEKAEGSSTITLKSIHISNSNYIKPTVDSKGRVIGGSNSPLTSNDITNLSWNKIAQDKPTTLDGYGITDAVKLSGGILNGFIKFNGSITDNLQAVTKEYVDIAVSSSYGLEVGDIIRKPYSTTPPGFLKCNGGLVSKTTYADLYAVIGDKYNNYLTPGAGKPWKQQYQINSEQDGDITGWTTGPSLPGPLSHSQAIVTKNRVYLLGGWNSNVVYTAPINSNGTLGSWATGTSLPVNIGASQAIVTKNRVYLLGRHDGSSDLSSVYTAPINSDGTLGSWSAAPSLPGPLSHSSAIVTKNRVYLLGGRIGDGNYVFIIYTAPINSDGTLGSWTQSGNLPIGVHAPEVIVTRNRVYILGGYSNSGIVPNIYTAPINSNGTLGSWTQSGNLPIPLSHSQVIVTKNRVYLFGGWTTNRVEVSNVYTAPINSDGTLGSWTNGPSLPGQIRSNQAIVTKNRIYLLGGYSSDFVSTVFTATISGGLNDYSPWYDGSIGPANFSDKFTLPDTSNIDGDGIYHYIKY